MSLKVTLKIFVHQLHEQGDAASSASVVVNAEILDYHRVFQFAQEVTLFLEGSHSTFLTGIPTLEKSGVDAFCSAHNMAL